MFRRDRGMKSSRNATVSSLCCTLVATLAGVFISGSKLLRMVVAILLKNQKE
jgi:hypothetical protein